MSTQVFMTFPTTILRSSIKNNTKYLNLIARATGSLRSASNELRWLQEHVHARIPPDQPQSREAALLDLCRRREKHEPLQYILGSQPFGELDIKCRPGVLIPRCVFCVKWLKYIKLMSTRPETEAYTTYLGQLLNAERDCHASSDSIQIRKVKEEESRMLSILDVCSGSGCISLLLHAHLTQKFPRLEITGWDISPEALALSRENLEHNVSEGHLTSIAREQVHYRHVDVFDPSPQDLKQIEHVDIIISNPPYISPAQLLTETTQSVREWEPRLALVPKERQKLRGDNGMETHDGVMHDVFYAQLIRMYSERRRCRALIMEVGDADQALRVAKRALEDERVRESTKLEIWRDYPAQEYTENSDNGEDVNILGSKVPIIGAGEMRSVALLRNVS